MSRPSWTPSGPKLGILGAECGGPILENSSPVPVAAIAGRPLCRPIRDEKCESIRLRRLVMIACQDSPLDVPGYCTNGAARGAFSVRLRPGKTIVL